MPDLGAYAAVDSLGWAEQEIPSVAEEVSADMPADWLLPLPPKPGGAGPSVPGSLAASVVCDAASVAAVVAVAAGVGNQFLGTAGTGCGWPFQGQVLALLPAVASSDVLRYLGTGKAWCCDSCSFAEFEDSFLPWVAGAAAAGAAAGAGQLSGHLPA